MSQGEIDRGPASERLRPMMDCGHAANAYQTHDDGTRTPVCAICSTLGRGGTRVAAVAPSLEGRTATCSCGEERPSSSALAFFEYRGPGAKNLNCAVCHYAECVHHEINPVTGRPGDTSHAFVPWVRDTDLWYCGHSGWD